MTSAEIEFTLKIQAPIVHSIEWSNQALDVLRLDMMHPIVQGNKWFKLMYNLLAIQEGGFRYAVTYGGAFSNHIHAFSYACRELRIPCIGIIRGEEPKVWSQTLLDAKRWGMQLEFITREAYADKETEDFKGWVRETFGDVFIIPEGGANYLGVNGCMEISRWLPQDANVICCSAGTGTMAAGLLLKLRKDQELHVFPALKGVEYMRHEIRKHLHYFLMDEEVADELIAEKLTIHGDFHFGGYAKKSPELLAFIQRFETDTSIPLDEVYTGKLFYGVTQVAATDSAWKNKRVVVIQSGGLQGNRGLTAS